MMREKKVNQATITRYIDFLNFVKQSSLPNESSVSLSWIADKGHVAQAAPKALEEIGIIQKEGKFWHWIKGEPNKNMVLEILDFNLKKTKKVVHYPIPEFAAIGDSLKEITERLIQITVHQERALKTAKNTPLETHLIGATIFDEQQQRFEMVKAVAGGIFKDFNNLNDYQAIGHRIITVADHILELLNKPK